MSITPGRFLFSLILVLAGSLTWLWVDQQGQLRGLTWVTPPAIRPDYKMPELEKQLSLADPAASYKAVLERPLFAADRRPPPPPPPPAAPDPLADIKIYGVFSGEQTGILARVEGKMRRIRVNESIGLWLLKSIDGRDITLTQGTETRQLHLAYSRLGETKVPTSPTGAAPAAPVSVTNSIAPLTRNPQDEAREYQRRRNEARAARGLPPVN